MLRLALRCLLLLLFPLSLVAQTWSILPGGAAGYTIPYSTTGFFVCDPIHGGITGGSCAASGNTMSITAAGGTLDFLYHNVSTIVTATQKPQRVSMGQIDLTFTGSGSPFYFPISARGTQPLFELLLPLTLDRPLAWLGIGYISTGTGMLTHNCCSDLVDRAETGVTPSPAPFVYTTIEFFGLNHPDILPEDETLDLTADVRIAPEPSTLLLVATGVVGVAGIGRRRNARRRLRSA